MATDKRYRVGEGYFFYTEYNDMFTPLYGTIMDIVLGDVDDEETFRSQVKFKMSYTNGRGNKCFVWVTELYETKADVEAVIEKVINKHIHVYRSELQRCMEAVKNVEQNIEFLENFLPKR